MKRLNQILIFITLITVITGCSTKKEPSPSTQKVTLQLFSGMEARSAGYYVALNKGFYMDEGLDVTINNGDLTLHPEDYVLNGSASFGTTTLPRLMIQRNGKKPLVHIAQILNKSGSLLVIKQNGPIKKMIDLLNKKISIYPDFYGIEIYPFLGDNGVSPKTINLVESKEPYADFLGNKSDMAIINSFKDMALFQNSRNTTEMYSFFTANNTSWGLPMDCLFTSESKIKENPDLCKAFVRATLKGWEYVLTNPKESISILSDYDKSNKMDKEIEFQNIRELSKLLVFQAGNKNINGQLSPEEFQRVDDQLIKYQLILNPVKDTEFFFKP